MLQNAVRVCEQVCRTVFFRNTVRHKMKGILSWSQGLLHWMCRPRCVEANLLTMWLYWLRIAKTKIEHAAIILEAT